MPSKDPEARRRAVRKHREKNKNNPEYRAKANARAREYRLKYPEKVKALRGRPEAKARAQELVLLFREAHPEVRAGQIAVQVALRSGKLIRPGACEECKVGCKPDAAHSDYQEPLNVRWLCRSCHATWDRRDPKTRRNGVNA